MAYDLKGPTPSPREYGGLKQQPYVPVAGALLGGSAASYAVSRGALAASKPLANPALRAIEGQPRITAGMIQDVLDPKTKRALDTLLTPADPLEKVYPATIYNMNTLAKGKPGYAAVRVGRSTPLPFLAHEIGHVANSTKRWSPETISLRTPWILSRSGQIGRIAAPVLAAGAVIDKDHRGGLAAAAGLASIVGSTDLAREAAAWKSGRRVYKRLVDNAGHLTERAAKRSYGRAMRRGLFSYLHRAPVLSVPIAAGVAYAAKKALDKMQTDP